MAHNKPMAEAFPSEEAPPPSPVGNPAATQPRTEAEIIETRLRYNAPPEGVAFEDDDPMSPAYARTNIDETPGSVLYFWFGYAASRPELIADRQKLWFQKSFDTDRLIAHRFLDILARLSAGEAMRWAVRGPRERLAAIIVLDQFSRNIFRDTPAAFENDGLALSLARAGIAAGEDQTLAPIERWFLYMPLEHAESSTCQRLSVEKFGQLAALAPPDQRAAFMSALDYARRHAAVIRRFGRYPHRNTILGRVSSTAEMTFLARPGSRF